jgi:formylglycine-generating enzyme required for sulfatase activity
MAASRRGRATTPRTTPASTDGDLPDALVRDLEPLRKLLHGDTPSVVLPVVGSGLSPGLLSWRGLLIELIERAPRREQATLRKELKKEKYLDVAEALEGARGVGAEGIAEAIARHYQRPAEPAPDIAGTYALIAALGVKHFATTNFDPWLKIAAGRHWPSPRVVVPSQAGAFADLGLESSPAVLMLHGDADDPGRCVLSGRAYARLSHGDRAFVLGLTALASARRFLFIGHSLSDPDLVAILEEWEAVFQASPPRHFFLGVAIQGHRRDWLLKRGVQPIDYGAPGAGGDRYRLLPAVLRHLRRRAATTRPGPSSAPSSARVRRVAIVAVVDELAQVGRAVRDALAATGGVTVELLDAAQPETTARVRGFDFVVALVGARLGSPGVFEAALAMPERAAAMLATVDLGAIPDADFAGLKRLHAEIDERFTNSDQAAGLAHQALARWLDKVFSFGPGAQGTLTEWERQYLKTKHGEWAQVQYTPLAERAMGRMQQAPRYVSLYASPQPWCHVDEAGRLIVLPPLTAPLGEQGKRRARGTLGEGEQEQKWGRPYLEAVLSHASLPALVFEGEGGSGKTMLLQHVAHALASRHLGLAMPEHRLDLEALRAGAPLPRVPILINASHVAEALQASQGHDEGVYQAVLRALASVPTPPQLDDVRAGLRHGRYLLLIDALDEVPGIAQREQVLHALANLARLDECPLRLVLTTRPVAYTGVAVPEPLRVVPLAPMDEDDARRLTRRWAAAQGYGEAYAEELIGAALGVRESLDVGNVLENPLLLTCLLLVYDTDKQLPRSTADLYEQMVRVMCSAKRDERVCRVSDPAARRQALEWICLGLQDAGGTARPLDAAARDLCRERPELCASVEEGESLVSQLAEVTALVRLELAPSGERRTTTVVRPWHRTFQEYLAASRLAAGPGSVATKARALTLAPRRGRARVDDPAWEGVLRFLGGVFGRNDPENARTYVRVLMTAARAASAARSARRREGRLFGLAASVVAEYPQHFKTGRWAGSVSREIVGAFEARGKSWPWRDRVLALDALGRLPGGDPRLKGDAWVKFKAGRFRMGGDEKAYQSAPEHEVEVGEFWLRRWPVTVGEYEEFVKAGGYGDKSWWDVPPEVRAPEWWERQRQHPNRPVVGVSWFEARAFCRWAKGAGWAPAGRVISLPTEEEWEYATRGAGTRGRTYAWGPEEPGEGDDGRASYGGILGGSNVPESATPVGAYPSGHSPDGVWDLTGNVWEWTACRWRDEGKEEDWRPGDTCHQDDIECRSDDKSRQQSNNVSAGDDSPIQSLSAAPRAVRGGSWGLYAWHLRAAGRDWSGPGNRDVDLGFRVVCRGSRQHD